MHTIIFNFEQKGLTPITLNNIPAGESLLEIALNNNINLHHNCGMVCACSTCHLYIESGAELLPDITDREEDFIDRANNPKINSRLGCQCILNEGMGCIKVTVPDQSLLHGE